MRLIIHAGLHKTASTYLQVVLCRSGRLLHDAGVYFEPDNTMLANHSSAWHASLGDLIGIREHVKLAKSRGRHTMILSSEDFEMMIFDHASAQLVETTARAGGVTDIEWHFCIRDAGDYFASQYAQLAQHVFVDLVAMFDAVMRDGRLHVINESGRYPLAWDHCFDYEAHLTLFAEAISGSVCLHEFRDGNPFPGHGILDCAVGRAMSYDLPTRPGALNRRLPPEEVEASFATKLEGLADAAGLSDATRRFLRERPRIPQSVVDDCAAAVRRRFAPGMQRVLQKYQATVRAK